MTRRRRADQEHRVNTRRQNALYNLERLYKQKNYSSPEDKERMEDEITTLKGRIRYD